MSASKRVLLIVMSACPLSCVTSEPVTVQPSINASPEEVALESATTSSGNDRSVSIGLDPEMNESDSLDNLEVLAGVRVASVVPSGAAASAGLRAGDVILSVNGVPMNDPDALTALVRRSKEGSELLMETRRDTVVFEATVVPRGLTGVSTPPRELYRIDPVRTRAGFSTAFIRLDGEQLTVARVLRIFPESPLPTAGVQTGNHILTLNGRPLASAQDLVTTLLEEHEPGDEVSLEVVHDGRRASVELALWEPERRLTKLAVFPLFGYETKLEPSSVDVSILDFWLFSVFRYRRVEGEREYRIFSLIRFGTGYGELVEESVEEQETESGRGEKAQ